MHLLHQIAPPIAMLHLVNDSVDPLLHNWCISRKRFVQLLDYLEKNEYHTTHFAAITQSPKQGNFRQQVILSFDDCARSLLDFAVPELIKRKMKAAFYMPTAYIDKYNAWDVKKGAERIPLMNENDLRDLVRAGMEVGSHSHTHVELRKVFGTKELTTELSLSKEILESITGQPVHSFAYPFGSVPVNYKQLLTDAGYTYGLSIYQPFETRLALRRFGFYEKDTDETLSRKLSGRYKWMRKVYDVVKKY